MHIPIATSAWTRLLLPAAVILGVQASPGAAWAQTSDEAQAIGAPLDIRPARTARQPARSASAARAQRAPAVQQTIETDAESPERSAARASARQQTAPAATRSAAGRKPAARERSATAARNAAPAATDPQPAAPRQGAGAADLALAPAVAAAAVVAATGAPAAAQPTAESAQPSGERAADAKGVAQKPPAAPAAQSLEERYCMGAAEHASQALFAWQSERLNALQAQIEARIAELEERRAAHERWESRQREQQERLAANFISIIARMRPDAAAAQLAAMDETTASLVLARLDPRNASTILNEMAPPKAARLADNMTGRPNAPEKR